MPPEEQNSEELLTLPASYEVKMREVEVLESGRFSEEELERALIIVPELFDPDPFFCGRQLPTDSGPIDLFGFVGIELPSLSFRISKTVFPTVYELKKGKIQRNALIQALDYSMRLEAMTAEDLAWHIVRNSGKPGSGTDRIWKPQVITGWIRDGLKKRGLMGKLYGR